MLGCKMVDLLWLPCWVSEAKTIKYCFRKRWSPKRELTEPSKRRRQATTRDGEWREAEPATSNSASLRTEFAIGFAKLQTSFSATSCAIMISYQSEPNKEK